MEAATLYDKESIETVNQLNLLYTDVIREGNRLHDLLYFQHQAGIAADGRNLHEELNL